ncbi:MAG: amidohydrolase family protein [Hyphomicrobiales bacterium]
MERPLLLAGGTVVTVDAARRIIADGAVLVEGGRIRAVGKAAALAVEAPVAEIIDTSGALVVPGFVDIHNHPAHFLSKGLFDDIETGRRWATRLYPFDTRIGDAQAYWGSLGTFAEMIRNGTTCFGDPGSYFPEATIRAAKDIGMRGVVTRSITDLHDPNRPTPDNLLGSADTVVASARRLHDEFHGSEDGRIRIWLGLRSVTATSDELCRKIKELADTLGVGIHVHLAVNPTETAQCLAKWHARPVERYDRLGLIDANLLAVHMGAIDETEVALLARRKVKIGHCPSASMLGAFGCVAHGKFPELVSAGVTIGLGTDAAAISRFLDLVRVMYLAACAHKDAHFDAEIMGAHKAFEMATIEGARGLLWDDEIGSIEDGKCADLTIIDCGSWEWQPRPEFNPVANLVYSASGSSVRDVMIDGRFIMRDRKLLTIDLAAVSGNIRQAAAEAMTMAGIAAEPVWPIS